MATSQASDIARMRTLAQHLVGPALADPASVVEHLTCTRAQLLALWNDAGITTTGGNGYHLIENLASRALIVLGPTDNHGEHMFVRTDTWIPHPRTPSRPDAIREWMIRYLHSHGPATLVDFLWWTKLAKRDIQPVVADVMQRCLQLTIDGVEYWMSPELHDRYADAKRATNAVLLVPGFDELALGYKDRSATIRDEHVQHVVPGSNGVFRHAVCVAGTAVATWKRPKQAGHQLEVKPFDDLPPPAARALPTLTANPPGR